MTTDQDDRPQLEEPLAALERELITAYVSGAGESVESLRARTDERARRLLADASMYATSRLTEIESRLHYLRELRGQE
jgi:hypothetical protein